MSEQQKLFETTKDPDKIVPIDIIHEKLGYCQVAPFFPPKDKTCVVCGKINTTIQQAVKHAYIHDPVCQFKCRDCNDQLFQTPVTLVTHKRNKHKQQYDAWQIPNQAWRARTCFVREQKLKKEMKKLAQLKDSKSTIKKEAVSESGWGSVLSIFV